MHDRLDPIQSTMDCQLKLIGTLVSRLRPHWTKVPILPDLSNRL